MKRAYTLILAFCLILSGCSMQELGTAGESFKEYLEQKDNSGNGFLGSEENNNKQIYSAEDSEKIKDSGITNSYKDKDSSDDKKADNPLEILDYKKAADEEMEKNAIIDEEINKIRSSLKFNQYTFVRINYQNYYIGNSSKDYYNVEDIKKDYPFLNIAESFGDYLLKSIRISLNYPYDLVKMQEPGKIIDGPEICNSSIGYIYGIYENKDDADCKIDMQIYNKNIPAIRYMNTKNEEVIYKNQKYNIIIANNDNKIQLIDFLCDVQGTVMYCSVRKYKLSPEFRDWFDNSTGESISFVNSIRESLEDLFAK